MDRLYVVVDANLPSGLKMAQACHALRAFVAEHPDVERQWFEKSNNLVILEHPELASASDELESGGFTLTRFHEPDLKDELTAVCVEPRAWRWLSKVKLAS